MSAGKGSKPRPVDKSKFNSNFDEIKWKETNKNTQVVAKKGKTTFHYPKT